VISNIRRTLVSGETRVSPDIVDRYHDRVNNVEEVNEQIVKIVLMLVKLTIFTLKSKMMIDENMQ